MTPPVSTSPKGRLEDANNAAADNNNILSRQQQQDDDTMVETALFRLTKGLPKRELKLMVQEATDCEALLLEDIRILEEALAKEEAIATDEPMDEAAVAAADNSSAAAVTASTAMEKNTSSSNSPPINSSAALSIILESPLTPLDRYWTISALLGRLNSGMALPSLLSAQTSSDGTAASLLKKSQPMAQPSANDILLNSITTMTASTTSSNTNAAAAVTKKEPDPLAAIYSTQIIPVPTLLAIFKKIMSNRAANVFKRPVKNDEAPGYVDRIMFPMDLSMIRKRIVANQIQTFSQLHEAVGLISHNCVKYNGRESDYGRVARDFEAMVANLILQAMQQHATIVKSASTAASTAAAGGGGPVANSMTGSAPPKPAAAPVAAPPNPAAPAAATAPMLPAVVVPSSTKLTTATPTNSTAQMPKTTQQGTA